MATRGKLNPTSQDTIYLAGMMDADGCVSIYKCFPKSKSQKLRNPRYVLQVTVTNTCKRLMDWLVSTFGGHYKARAKVSEKHKTTYSWFFNNGKAAELLELVEPFLIVKQTQARVGIEFIENRVTPRPGVQLPPEELARREKLTLMMRELNQTGDTAATTESSGSCTVRRMMRQSELVGNYEREVEALPRRQMAVSRS